MRDEFQAFVEDPTGENFQFARDALLNEFGIRADALDLAELSRLADDGCFDELRTKVQAMMPDWALSPRVHYLAACAAEQLGDDDDAELERFLFTSCLRGLYATGDGSPARPFLVTYVSDESAVVETLGLRARRQTLIERDGSRFDVVTCYDGSEIWFDVTDLLRGAESPVAEAWQMLG